MTGHHCPVEGCDYGEQDEKSLPAVRSHINASNDGAHDWDRLKQAVEAQGEESTEKPDTEQSDKPEEGNDEPDEQQSEATETDENAMVTRQEYERQQNGQTDSSESEADEGDSDGGDTASNATKSIDGFLPDLSLSTYVLVASALLAAFVIWRVWQSRRQSEPVDLDEDNEDSNTIDRNEVTMLE